MEKSDKKNLENQKSSAGRRRITGADKLNIALEIIFLAILFFVPLFFAGVFKSYNIFNLNKMVLFRILLGLAFLLTATREIFYPSRLIINLRIFFQEYWLWPSIFIMALGVPVLFSGNATLSFFGSIDRQLGYASYLSYFLWILILSFNLAVFKQNEQDKTSVLSFNRALNNLMIAAVLAGSIASLYGLMQILGFDFYQWTEPIDRSLRASSTFGNSNFFASWLLMIIPSSLYLVSIAKRSSTRFFYSLVLILNIIGIFISGSRGAILALIFISLIFGLYLISRRGLKRKKMILLLSALFIFNLVLAAIFNQATNGRLLEIFNFKTGTVAERLDFYQAALDAIKKKPILGYGQENLVSVFISYYQPEWGSRNIGQIPDRAHNIILDILLFGGLSALLAFATLYSYFFKLINKSIRHENNTRLTLGIGLGAAGYIFSLLFGFSIPAGEIYFFSFLAIIIANDFSPRASERASERNQTREPKDQSTNVQTKIILFAACLLISAWSIYKAGQIIVADHYFAKAVLAWNKGDYPNSLKYFGKIERTGSNPVNLAFYRSYETNSVINAYASTVDQNLQENFANRVKRIAPLIPENEPYLTIAKAQAEAAQGLFASAQEGLAALKAKAPFWPMIYLEEARLNILEDKIDEAINSFSQALDNMPEFKGQTSQFHYVAFYGLAELYRAKGNFKQAEKYYSLAYQADPSKEDITAKIHDMETLNR